MSRDCVLEWDRRLSEKEIDRMYFTLSVEQPLLTGISSSVQSYNEGDEDFGLLRSEFQRKIEYWQMPKLNNPSGAVGEAFARLTSLGIIKDMPSFTPSSTTSFECSYSIPKDFSNDSIFTINIPIFLKPDDTLYTGEVIVSTSINTIQRRLDEIDTERKQIKTITKKQKTIGSIVNLINESESKRRKLISRDK